MQERRAGGPLGVDDKALGVRLGAVGENHGGLALEGGLGAEAGDRLLEVALEKGSLSRPSMILDHVSDWPDDKAGSTNAESHCILLSGPSGRSNWNQKAWQSQSNVSCAPWKGLQQSQRLQGSVSSSLSAASVPAIHLLCHSWQWSVSSSSSAMWGRY